jgi:hypothetical protein
LNLINKVLEEAGNPYLRGRFRTVDLLTKAGCFKEIDFQYEKQLISKNMEVNCTLILSLQQGFPARGLKIELLLFISEVEARKGIHGLGAIL